MGIYGIAQNIDWLRWLISWNIFDHDALEGDFQLVMGVLLLFRMVNFMENPMFTWMIQGVSLFSETPFFSNKPCLGSQFSCDSHAGKTMPCLPVHLKKRNFRDGLVLFCPRYMIWRSCPNEAPMVDGIYLEDIQATELYRISPLNGDLLTRCPFPIGWLINRGVCFTPLTLGNWWCRWYTSHRPRNIFTERTLLTDIINQYTLDR